MKLKSGMRSNNKTFLLKELIILFLTLYGLTSFAQNFGEVYTGGYESSKSVQKEFDKAIINAKKTRTIYSTSKDTINDTLVYIIQDAFDGFKMKVTFNLEQEYYTEKFCDFQQIEFDCTPCSNKHLEETIRSCKFRQKSDNVYLSQPLYSTEMTLTYGSDSKDCLIITYRYVNLPHKEYKKEYKKLKRKKS